MNLPLHPITRRALLRGTCASLLLPLLPSLSWADDPSVPMPRAPKRWVTIIFANGAYPDHWWAKGTGPTMELGKTLKPLDDYRGMFSVLSNLHILDHLVPNEGPHTPYFCNMLNGAHVSAGLLESCDQLLARTIGQDSFLGSLTLGTEPSPYTSSAMLETTISWSSPTTAVPPIVSPRDAFDALFDVKGLVRRKSILDSLLGDVQDIHGELSLEDARKLDEYTSTIRDLERRIELTMHPIRTGWQPSLSAPDMLRPVQNSEQILHQNLGVRHRLMLRILALALQMDKTRVATLVLEADQSNASMGFIPGVSNTGLHILAHHAAVEQSIREYQLTNEYHVSLLASFLKATMAVDEGGQTLLDNSMVLFGSHTMDGNIHDADHLPLILAGKGGGTLKPGANLNFTAMEDRRICNLHLSLLQRMGVLVNGQPIRHFGSSIHPLEGI